MSQNYYTARNRAIILVKIWWNSIGVWDIPFCFCFFEVTNFPPGKWGQNCVATSVHAAQFYRHRVHWPQSVNKSRISQTVFQIPGYSTWKRKKNFGKRKKLVLSLKPPDWGSVWILWLSVAVSQIRCPNR